MTPTSLPSLPSVESLVAADKERRAFIQRLDRLAITRGLSLPDWEKHFVADLITSPRPFMDDQRDVIDKLRKRFSL